MGLEGSVFLGKGSRVGPGQGELPNRPIRNCPEGRKANKQRIFAGGTC